MPRACVIVLDAVGAGALPDASDYGDEGSDTLGNVAKAVGGLDLPNLEALGLGNVEPLEGCPAQPGAPAVAGRLIERSKGKDTTTGHWELVGVVTPQPMPTYPHGFPHDVTDPCRHQGARGRDDLGHLCWPGHRRVPPHEVECRGDPADRGAAPRARGRLDLRQPGRDGHALGPPKRPGQFPPLPTGFRPPSAGPAR